MITEKELKALWQEAFDDPELFLDAFFRTGFGKDRYAVLLRQGELAGALYWFDCFWGDRKLAYIYAVATAKKFRRQGVCRELMEKAHTRLQQAGYAGAVLVPAKPELAAMYEIMGYRHFGGMKRLEVKAQGQPVRLTLIGPEEYEACKEAFLKPDSIRQGGKTLAFLNTYARFYRGEDTLFAVATEGQNALFQEYFGDPEKLPGILQTLQVEKGSVRLPDGETPFGMYRSFTGEKNLPAYLGIALD